VGQGRSASREKPWLKSLWAKLGVAIAASRRFHFWSNSLHQGATIDQPIPAAEAKRTFSRLLREVREGRSYVVTSHGKPIARIVPCTQADTACAAARSALLQRLALQPAIDIGCWTRDEL
jgi:prevent-host-death family protein